MSNKTTFVSFLLDETGSMQSIKDDTVGGFNAYLDTLKKGGDSILFSLVSFNSSKTLKRYVAEPVTTIQPLSEDDYQPHAMTPLIDAAVKIITATDEAVSQRTDEPNVVIVMQTDGMENVSVEYTTTDLALLIKEKEAAGWQFVFLGAGLDAFAAAREAGIVIDASRVVSYDRQMSHEVFAATAANVEEYARSGDEKNLVFSHAQRAQVGDKYTDQYLDATAPETTPPKKKRVEKKDRRSSTVDDIKL
ncbi:MAG: VWA domain-containing protein [Rhodothermales bacterium]|nr:VWA domain-containing protein [Rhodothermales bacterium]